MQSASTDTSAAVTSSTTTLQLPAPATSTAGMVKMPAPTRLLRVSATMSMRRRPRWRLVPAVTPVNATAGAPGGEANSPYSPANRAYGLQSADSNFSSTTSVGWAPAPPGAGADARTEAPGTAHVTTNS